MLVVRLACFFCDQAVEIAFRDGCSLVDPFRMIGNTNSLSKGSKSKVKALILCCVWLSWLFPCRGRVLRAVLDCVRVTPLSWCLSNCAGLFKGKDVLWYVVAVLLHGVLVGVLSLECAAVRVRTWGGFEICGSASMGPLPNVLSTFNHGLRIPCLLSAAIACSTDFLQRLLYLKQGISSVY